MAAGVYMAQLYRAAAPEAGDTQGTLAHQPRLLAALASVLILAPFVMPLLATRGHTVSPPPRGVMAREIAFNSYEVKLAGQAADVASYWFGPFGDGRHHALTSCMKFRGAELVPAAGETRIFVSEERWMTEFFLHNGKLLSGYPAYLISSFMPFSPAGIHLIIEAPRDAVGKDFFKAEAARIAGEVARLSHDQTRQQNAFVANSMAPGVSTVSNDYLSFSTADRAALIRQADMVLNGLALTYLQQRSL